MSNVTRAQAHSVRCPNCYAQPGQKCTQPTDDGRRAVPWVHLAREHEYQLQAMEDEPEVTPAEREVQTTILSWFDPEDPQ